MRWNIADFLHCRAEAGGELGAGKNLVGACTKNNQIQLLSERVMKYSITSTQG